MRQEVELAKAELRESATRAGKGAGMFGGAGLAGYFVLLFLSIAVWWGLGDHLGRGWSQRRAVYSLPLPCRYSRVRTTDEICFRPGSSWVVKHACQIQWLE